MDGKTNVFEDVSIDDDSHQVIVATLGDLISAKNVKTGSRSAQWLGQMSDATLQQLSRIRVCNETKTEQPEVTVSHKRVGSNVKDEDGQNGLVTCFTGRHGAGRQLK